MNRLPALNINRHTWRFLKNSRWRSEFVKSFNTVHQGIGRKYQAAAASRQMRTAYAILDRLKGQKGLLLADDVGTGKTTVAAWVILAFVKSGKSVSVLAPNASMRRRWKEEIEWLLTAYAALEGPQSQLEQKTRGLSKLIRFGTHLKNTNTDLGKDLLVIDEAHRAKNEHTQFAKRIRKVAVHTRLLILTATPFSLSVRELNSLLKRIGAPTETLSPCKTLAEKLEKLWSGVGIGLQEEFAKILVHCLKEAHKAIRGVVFRTSVEKLSPREKHLYGEKEPWTIMVNEAKPQHLQLLAEMDRLGQVGKLRHHYNDPRYHQGWAYIDQVLAKKRPLEGDRAVYGFHRKSALQIRHKLGSHPKLIAVSKAIAQVVAEGEKVVVFCDYHATAAEVAAELARYLGTRQRVPRGKRRKLAHVLRKLLIKQRAIAEALKTDRYAEEGLNNYCEWLASPGLAAQLADQGITLEALKRPAGAKKEAGFAKQAAHLFLRLIDRQSSSTRKKLLRYPRQLPGQTRWRVVALCDPPESITEKAPCGIFETGEPDTIMALFNSPFGPEVLVTTDRLSEGVDLHRHCRHLVHYELDPSPLRVIQREGRVRRIDSWACRSGKPVKVATPALKGTRDERLVDVVANRLQQFDMLLGGVNQPINGNLAQENLADQGQILRLVRGKLPDLSLRPA
jgi:ERCC4-related helicase